MLLLNAFIRDLAVTKIAAGGTVDLFCPHGVVYGLTPLPKSESPQDAISLVTWLRHLPNVVFYDCWCTSLRELADKCQSVGATLDKRDGAIIASDDLKKRDASPLFSVSGLAIEHNPSFSSLDRKDGKDQHHQLPGIKRQPHPVSQSDVFVAVHDRLHGQSHIKCAGRNPDMIVELRSLNSMVHEQQYSARKKVAVWLRNHSAQRNMFMLRFLAHRRARQTNMDHLSELNRQLVQFNRNHVDVEWYLELNAVGRVVFRCRPRVPAPAVASV